MWKFWVVEGEVEGFLIRLEFRLCHFQMPHGTRTPLHPIRPVPIVDRVITYANMQFGS